MCTPFMERLLPNTSEYQTFQVFEWSRCVMFSNVVQKTELNDRDCIRMAITRPMYKGCMIAIQKRVQKIECLVFGEAYCSYLKTGHRLKSGQPGRSKTNQMAANLDVYALVGF